MALQTSGPISLANIQTEFGGSNPISLSEYYAGGTYVGAGTSGTNGAVPSSGTISLSKFYGTSSLKVTASNVFKSASGFTPCSTVTTASVSGTNTTVTGGTAPYTFQWTRIDGASQSVNTATSQNPTFFIVACDYDELDTATWQVTVTDSAGRTASTTIQVTIIWVNLS